jgi:hypothetical protein
MYYSYVEIEYVATSFSPARTDLAVKLLTNRLTRSDDLSKISSSIVLSLPLTFLVINRMIVGNSTTSNQLEAGLIMVRAMKSIDEPSLPLSVYKPMRSTQRASHGVLITIDRNCNVLPLSLDDLLNYTTLMLKFCKNKPIGASPFLSSRVRTGTKVCYKKSMPVDWPSCQHM